MVSVGQGRARSQHSVHHHSQAIAGVRVSTGTAAFGICWERQRLSWSRAAPLL